MPNTNYWADDYIQKKNSAQNVLKHIKSGQRILSALPVASLSIWLMPYPKDQPGLPILKL